MALEWCGNIVAIGVLIGSSNVVLNAVIIKAVKTPLMPQDEDSPVLFSTKSLKLVVGNKNRVFNSIFNPEFFQSNLYRFLQVKEDPLL